jgi:hypothetical protein
MYTSVQIFGVPACGSSARKPCLRLITVPFEAMSSQRGEPHLGSCEEQNKAQNTYYLIPFDSVSSISTGMLAMASVKLERHFLSSLYIAADSLHLVL